LHKCFKPLILTFSWRNSKCPLLYGSSTIILNSIKFCTYLQC
jgi:hypothetical protein